MKGLYIHIPFCKSKCKYCDFASFDNKYDLMDKYIDFLLEEAKQYIGTKFDTIYFGGGTPTVLSEKNLYKIIDFIYKKYSFNKETEFTIEANPATISKNMACFLKECGVNRVSMGSQSFIDKELLTLGRIHTACDIEKTFYILRDCGFDNISLDLMFGIPCQTETTLSTSIDRVLNLKPEHISCYGLKIEDNTPFYDMLKSGQINELNEDKFADMYDLLVKMLENSGYERYEISNFCKDGKISRHNTNYWRCNEYVGLGLGASSYVDGVRFTKAPHFDSYFNNFALSERQELTLSDKMREFIIFGLRLTKEGISINEFKRRFNKDIFDVFGNELTNHIKKGYILSDENTLKIAPNMCYVSNAILCDYI